jgi:hypothetical protein
MFEEVGNTGRISGGADSIPLHGIVVLQDADQCIIETWFNYAWHIHGRFAAAGT